MCLGRSSGSTGRGGLRERSLPATVARDRPDHVCLVYDELADQIAAVVPYMKIGLDRREKCLYVADDETVGEVRRSLEDAGVDINREAARGALSVLTKRDAYLRFGRFDPDEMVMFLGQSTEATRTEGFSALRITGEMTWALGPEVGCDRLIEYEVALNGFFPGSHALAVCQYHRQIPALDHPRCSSDPSRRDPRQSHLLECLL